MAKKATDRQRAERLRESNDALMMDASKRLAELLRERDRAKDALLRIANSVALVLGSRAVPVKLIPGLRAIEQEAREYSKGGG